MFSFLGKHNNYFIPLFFIGFIVFTQLWYAYPVIRHPKLQYWSFLNEWNNSKEHSFQSLKNSWARAMKTRDFETNIDSNFFIDIYGGVNFLMGKKQVGDVVKLNNGTIYRIQEEMNFSNSIEQLRQIRKFLDKKHIPLLFVVAPSTIHEKDTQLPRGVADYSNFNGDKFIEILKSEGIDYIDAREIFKNNPEEHYRLFMKADHHWQPKYAFYVYQKTAERLNKRYGFNIAPPLFDKTKFEDIEVEVSERPYRGMGINSGGKLVGRFQALPDTYLLYEPLFCTTSHFTVDYLTINKQGNHEKTWRQSGVYGLQKSINFNCQEKKSC